MQKKNLKLPVGIESFNEIRMGNYYYVDKTMLIEQIIENGSKVTLFTRPRRFGKSLNISMLKSFFEIGTTLKLFKGLYISENKQLCKMHMGKYPIIAISLKGVDADSYSKAKAQIVKIINKEARRYRFFLESTKLDSFDKELLTQLLSRQMEEDTITNSLLELTELLEAYFSKKVIVLIDEYDVPLAKAHENGYYDEMVLLIRNLFGNVLKTNDSLAFAVLTGCLRISKESIFTGLNNFKIYSITDKKYDETFGFTHIEVEKMLQYYGLEAKSDEVQEWYDGYCFGNVDVYCPWDVVNYCCDHMEDANAKPKNYWMNTSGNEIIKHFVDSINSPGMLTKTELEWLVNGEIVIKKVDEMITYKELYSSMDNLWSTLFMTGYLTQRGQESDGRYRLAIPNREIRTIIIERVLTLFRKEVLKDGELLKKFCDSLIDANAKAVEQLLTEYLSATISVRDTFVKSVKENFYHGILIGILGYKNEWRVSSNEESGDRFSDILIRIGDGNNRIGIIIELKYSKDEKSLEDNCREALRQIEEKHYEQALKKEGIHNVLKYGIAFWMKKCRVLLSK